MNYLIWMWLGVMVLFGVVEALTAGLVSIWFLVGAAAALVSALSGAGLAVQLVLFVIVSSIALAATRPLARKLIAKKTVPTNLDRVIGGTAKVTEVIDNENSTGAVYVDGKTWSARSMDGGIIPVGELVCVKRMEGVKLFVENIKKTAEVM